MSGVASEPATRIAIEMGPVSVEMLLPETYARKIKIAVENGTPKEQTDGVPVQETQPPGECPEAMQCEWSPRENLHRH